MRTTRICSTTMVCMRPSGTGKQLERRRRHAIALLQAGVSYREVARQVGATLSSVVRWHQAHRRDKWNGLSARPIPGRPCRLSAAQQEQLKGVLRRGAEAAGYRTELWTLKRIGEVIRKQFGVRYSPVGVTRDEVRAVLDRLHGVPLLMVLLLYGAGLRLLECARLRIKDVDFVSNQIVV